MPSEEITLNEVLFRGSPTINLALSTTITLFTWIHKKVSYTILYHIISCDNHKRWGCGPMHGRLQLTIVFSLA